MMSSNWWYFRLENDALHARFFWSPDHNTWVVQMPTTFTYTNPTATVVAGITMGTVPANAVVMDVNGDGLPDFVAPAASASGTQALAFNSSQGGIDVIDPATTIAVASNSGGADAQSFSPWNTPSSFAAGTLISDGNVNPAWTQPEPASTCCALDASGNCILACPPFEPTIGQQIFTPRLFSSGWTWAAENVTSPLTGGNRGGFASPSGGDCGASDAYYQYLTSERPLAVADIDGDGLADEVLASEVVKLGTTGDQYTCCMGIDPSTGTCVNGVECPVPCQPNSSIQNVDLYFGLRLTSQNSDGTTNPFGLFAPPGTTRSPANDGFPALAQGYIASIPHFQSWPYTPTPGGNTTEFYEDANGDGLADLVIVDLNNPATSIVGYLPGLGNARLGYCPANTSCTNDSLLDSPHPIWLQNTVTFAGVTSPSRVMVHDLNGDGLADVILKLPKAIVVGINQSGTKIASNILVSPPSGWDPDKSHVYFADMNASGVDDLVVVANNVATYYDMVGGVRPGLLTAIDNGLGGTTTLAYQSLRDIAVCGHGGSTCNPQFTAFNDDVFSQQWGTNTPQPIHVVSKVTVTNNLAPPLKIGYIWRPQGASSYPSTSPTTGLPVAGDVERDLQFNFDSSGRMTDEYATLRGTATLDRFHALGQQVAKTPTSVPAEGSVLRVKHIDYDTYGNPVTVRGSDSVGSCQKVTYDPFFNQLPIQQQTFPQANCAGTAITTNESYDRGFAAVSSRTTPDNATTTYAYDDLGRVTNVTRPDPVLGLPTQNDKNVTYHDNPSSGTPATPQQIYTTNFDGTANRVSVEYRDGLGNALFTIQDADTSAGDVSPYVVSGGRRFGTKGDIVEEFEPFFWSGSVLSFPLTGGTPFPSASSRQQYDGFGRIVLRYDTSGTLVQGLSYHALSIDAYDGENFARGRHPYAYLTVTKDGHGRNVSITKHVTAGTTPKTTTTSTVYSGAGKPLMVTQTDGTTTIQRSATYDSLGQMVTNVEPNTTTAAHSWKYVYDAEGDLVGTSDARGCGENLTYDAAGRVTSEDYSPCLGSQATYTQPLGLGNVWGNEVVYNYYPGTGRLQSVQDLASSTAYTYDLRGRTTLTTRQLAKPGAPDPVPGNRYTPHVYARTVGYDEMDRPTDEGTGADLDIPQLLAPAQKVGANRSDVTTHYSARGLVSSVDGAYGTLIAKATYNADGKLHSRTLGDVAATQENILYNPELWPSNVSLIRSFFGPSPAFPTTQIDDLELLSIVYDAVGNPLTVADGTDQSLWAPGSRPRPLTTYTYDDFYHVTGASYTDFSGTAGSWSDAFVSPDTADVGSSTVSPLPMSSAAGRMTSQTFQYDLFGNLTTSVDDVGLFYDRSLGTITNGNGSGIGPNQLQSATLAGPGAGNASANYDPTGNLSDLRIQRAEACITSEGCNQRLHYDWDEVGRLARARRWDYGSLTASSSFYSTALPSSPPAADISYAYDSTGQRVLRATTLGTGTPTTTAEIFPTLRLEHASWDGILDYIRDASVEKVHLSSTGNLLGNVLYSASGLPGAQQHVLLEVADPLGSTNFVIDRDSGEMVERIAYQPYGATESDFRPGRWESYREPYRFTAKEDDREVGLTYFGARYYAPWLNRWIGADPKAIHAMSGDLNPYAYVSGQTQHATDPQGLDSNPLDDVAQLATPWVITPTGTTDNPAAAAVLPLIYALGSVLPNLTNPSPTSLAQYVDAFINGGANSVVTPVAVMFNVYTGSNIPTSVPTFLPEPDDNPYYQAAKLGGGLAAGAGIAKVGSAILGTSMEISTSILSEGSSVERLSTAVESAESFDALATTRCFVDGTPVWTANGPVPIETIRPGDIVFARNPESGIVELQPVSRTFVRRADDVVDVALLGADGRLTELQPTSEHPFLVEGKGWTPAAALRPGDLLWGPSGASLVQREVPVRGTHIVHNFEVAEDHSYVVGASGVLVHNVCGGVVGAVTEGTSVLEQASNAAFKAAEQVDQFSVPLKHLPGAGGGWSRFASGVDISGTIRESLQSGGARFLPNSQPGSFRVVTDLGRVIGEQGQTGVRIVIGEEGNIWTAFPVNP